MELWSRRILLFAFVLVPAIEQFFFHIQDIKHSFVFRIRFVLNTIRYHQQSPSIVPYSRTRLLFDPRIGCYERFIHARLPPADLQRRDISVSHSSDNIPKLLSTMKWMNILPMWRRLHALSHVSDSLVVPGTSFPSFSVADPSLPAIPTEIDPTSFTPSLRLPTGVYFRELRHL
jgi:hypothetical protein